jgi:transcription-repair coupling factor (superfamily II helicase)
MWRAARYFRRPPGHLRRGRSFRIFREPWPSPANRHLGTFSADQFDLKPGDYVVHVEHGVGQFHGVREIAQGDAKGDYMLIEYAGGNKLYVPLARMDLVQRFRGEGEAKPASSTRWAGPHGPAPKPASRPKCATWRRSCSSSTPRANWPRLRLLADSNWQREFEDAFEFTETRDQKTAIADIKRDMESPQPMDRLLCGDVGYGKTEVVMRAAFKAMGDGKQVAVLAPTTVLCFQHFKPSRSASSPFRCASKC